MSLFETSQSPAGIRPKRYGESIYAYYRDSERASMVAIRNLFELWFAEIPQSEQLDLQQRFRSPRERQHRSAVFEIFLHHLLIKSGFQVEFHPDMDGVTTHPDFLVTKEGSESFYLEAIAVSNSFTEEAEINRINQVYDTLNTLKSPDFYISVRLKGAPVTSPAGAKLRRDIERWLTTLDWRSVQEIYQANQFDKIPNFEWSHEGWNVIFEPIPKSENTRGTESIRAIGMTIPTQVRTLALDEQLRDAVTGKDRYGKVKLPFVIAVQVIDERRIEKYDVMNGLLGQETILIGSDQQTRTERILNGAWLSHTGPKHTSISAVLAWSTLDPWKFAAIEPIMVHNPYAAAPLSKDALAISQCVVDKDKGALVHEHGVSIANILGLQTDWLPED